MRPAVDLCGSCHAPIARAVQSQGAHTAAGRGDCGACHEPHGSKLNGLLKAPVKELCAKCHSDIGHKGDRVHQPVAEGNCRACHDPHGGAVAPSLTQAVPKLCLDCHDATRRNMLDAHKGNDMSQAACLGCHAAHSSTAEHLMPTNRHPASTTASARSATARRGSRAPRTCRLLLRSCA